MSFLINQNRTYAEERDAGLVYAPHADAGGARLSTYSAVGRLAPGDLTLSTRSGKIVAVGVVLTVPDLSASRPPVLDDSGWSSPGFLAEVEYHELDEAIELYGEVSEEIRISESAFDKRGMVKQGAYCEELSSEFDDYFLTNFATRLPDVLLDGLGVHGLVAEPPEPADASPGLGGTSASGLEKGGKTGTAYRRAARSIQVRLRHGGYVEDLSKQTQELLGDPGEGRTLRRSYTRSPWTIDLLLPIAGSLVEMKSELDTASVQKGVGQLLLYKSMLCGLASDLDFDPNDLTLALACPDKPDDQLQEDLTRLGIVSVWKQRGRWVDNAGGKVTGKGV